MSKQKLTLSIDQEVVKEAKEMEINISSFLEVRLANYIAIRKGMLPSGFEPESTAREAVMIDLTTLWEQKLRVYPPDET